MAGLGLLTAFAVLSGCSATSSTPATTGSASGSSATGSSTTPGASGSASAASGSSSGSVDPSATTTASDPITTAKTLAAMYNYAAAQKALAGIDSDQARTELAAIKKAAATAKPYADNSTISHIFYHSLVVDANRAFHAPQGKAQGYKDYMVTMREFNAQLAQIYANGYVLVHMDQIAKPKNGVMTYTPIVLPPGKKPLVLSIDDVSYYEYMTGDGFASNLKIAADGTITNTYIDAKGVSHDGSYDVVPLVDDFVRAHPDFSYQGAKGTLAMTGYNGVLGYRSSYRKYGRNAKTDAERAEATKVATAMKAEGWNFASHTYGHIDIKKSSLAEISADATKWNNEVRPIVGDTDELIFAFGADIAGVEKYSESNAKYHYLHDVQGFNYFANVDASSTHWIQLSGGSFRQARIDIDGITIERALAGHYTPLSAFFNVKSTVDPAR